MSFDPVTGILNIGGKLIDRLVPDKGARDKMKMEMIELQQRGELQELETRMSAILAEAKSNDPWTSRARPSFLYVVYLMILASIPMGVLSAFNPEAATAIATGMQAWLAAIPTELYALFGVGYSGYSVARSIDKKQISKINPTQLFK